MKPFIYDKEEKRLSLNIDDLFNPFETIAEKKKEYGTIDLNDPSLIEAMKDKGWTPPEPPIGEPELWVHKEIGYVHSLIRMTAKQLNAKYGKSIGAQPDDRVVVHHKPDGSYHGWDLAVTIERNYRKLTPEELALIKRVLNGKAE